MKEKTTELMDLCDELRLSIRFNNKTGLVNIYEELGEFECPEQALLFVKNIMKREERAKKKD